MPRRRAQHFKAEEAVAVEVLDMEMLLQGMKQEFMRERSTDIRDMGRRVLRNIRTSGEVMPNRLESLPPNTILVAQELLPSDTLQLDRANLAAFVTERNGPASHVAILARARGIPAVFDVKEATLLLTTGDHLLVDAEAGTVTVAPTRAQVARFALRKDKYTNSLVAADHESAQCCTTKDGVCIQLFANIGRTDEVHLIKECRFEGVGLFRSEFLFLDADEPPDLEAQQAAYSMVAEALHPSPIVIRTVDLGGDKIPRFAKAKDDIKLYTGKRGLAYTLANKTLFRTQLQAIVRTAQQGNVRLMFPMVLGMADLKEARDLVDEVIQTEHCTKRPAIGAMIETPASVFAIHEILKIVDFVSIGTNDLAHFILAIDRGSPEYPGVLSFMHPCVLSATKQVVQAAMNQAVDLSVCGEAAGDPATACLLVGMGVRNLSMSPFRAAGVRPVIRQLTLEQMENVARNSLSAATLEDVQDIVASALRRADA